MQIRWKCSASRSVAQIFINTNVFVILPQILCWKMHKRRLKKGKRHIQFSTTHLFPPTSSGMCRCKYVSPPHLTTLHLMQILQTTQKYTNQMAVMQNQIIHNWKEHEGLLKTSFHCQVILFQNQTKKPKSP